MKKVLLILLMASTGLTMSFGGDFYKNIKARQADKVISQHEGSRDLVILDVRTPGEFARGYIRGAVNIDFWSQGFVDSVSKLDRKVIYLVYCASGVRSAGAMKKMRQLGFEKIYNMKGGMFSWRAIGFPVIKRTSN